MTKLLEVQLREGAQAPVSQVRQTESHHTAVRRIRDADDETGPRCPVHELDGAVVPELEVGGGIPDRRSEGVVVPADSEQQLVLGCCEAGALGLKFTPPEEATYPCTEDEEPPVLVVAQHLSIVSRCFC